MASSLSYSDHQNIYADLYKLAVIIAGCFSVVAIILSIFLILRHLRSYNNPSLHIEISSLVLEASRSPIYIENTWFTLLHPLSRFLQSFADPSSLNFYTPSVDALSSSHKTTNGITQVDGVSTSNSKARDTYDSRKPSVEISEEKQKLASSLFGGSSKTEKRASSANHKVSKASNAAEKSQVWKAAGSHTDAAVEKTNHEPTPDLLDLGDSTVTSTAPSIDPFQQLEGLLDRTEATSTVNNGPAGASKTPEIMGLYADTPLNRDDFNLASELSNATRTSQGGVSQSNKGPNPKDSLEKDALVRQMGVTPTSQNPNLFSDLLG